MKLNAMRKQYALISLVMIVALGGCVNTQKLINSGQYDEAINLTVRKLQKNRNKEKHILRLEEAFYKVQQRDLDRIAFLKKEGNPDNSVEIFRMYEQIDFRQKKIEPLLPLFVDESAATFKFLNVDDEIISWKREAADYLYAHALSLLDKPDKLSARQAYDELQELIGFFPNYRDSDQRSLEAWNRGMNWITFRVENNSLNLIPQEFAYELRHTNLWPSEGKWFRFLGEQDDDSLADFSVVVNLRVVDVGPEQIKEIHYDETREIQTGEKDLLDEDGDVVKDSSGNVIKVPILKEVTAHIVETQQTKIGVLGGTVEFHDRLKNKFVHSDDFTVEALFEHFSASYSGSKEAMTEETKKKIGRKPVPFPTDFGMIMDGAEHLQPILIDIIQANRWILEGV